MCASGMTVHSPGANGRSVMNAMTSSSRWMTLAGEVPAMRSQKTQGTIKPSGGYGPGNVTQSLGGEEVAKLVDAAARKLVHHPLLLVAGLAMLFKETLQLGEDGTSERAEPALGVE